MTMDNARRQVARMKALDLLREAGTKDDVVDALERELTAGDMVMGAVHMLVAHADQGGARNYVKMECVGLPLPFDRVNIELMRPGGKTPHELKEEALGTLHTALILLQSVPPTPAIEAFVESVRRRFFFDAKEIESVGEPDAAGPEVAP